MYIFVETVSDVMSYQLPAIRRKRFGGDVRSGWKQAAGRSTLPIRRFAKCRLRQTGAEGDGFGPFRWREMIG